MNRADEKLPQNLYCGLELNTGVCKSVSKHTSEDNLQQNVSRRPRPAERLWNRASADRKSFHYPPD